GYPLDDGMLAEVLTKIDALEPCVIGLDLYRDLPEPRDQRSYPELESALKKLTRVLAITRAGYFGTRAARAKEPVRVVANNMPKDFRVDGSYRRAPRFIETGVRQPVQSLSLGLVLAYLEKNGTDFALEKGLLRLGKVTFPRLTP